MTFSLPEDYVGLSGVEPGLLIEHAEQVQRNFEALARGVRGSGLEAPHVVGGAGEPAFANAWANLDARVACFWRDGAMVYLRGVVTAGVVGAAIFTLPAGYLPSAAGVPLQPVMSNNLLGAVSVSAAGVVALLIGSNVYADLSPVSFRVA